MSRFLKDAIRSYVYWIGISWGVFYIPATALATAGTLLMVIPLWGTFLTGIVLLIVDPPSKWEKPVALSVLARLMATALAALLLFAYSNFTREGTQIFVGDWRENIAFCGGSWLIYIVAVGIATVAYNSNHKSEEGTI
ncbi:hypothetical protein [Cutibacterium sp.]|uniref:hypothetical protein n=1 Tax=Cutibacterium sp. TaxID=1912221 RepID=UPI0026DD73F6|nr:hypothetical protein [Cutibacterium sp.]MDO4413206.1 hypothetical protein [Cutibacterium sp.]